MSTLFILKEAYLLCQRCQTRLIFEQKWPQGSHWNATSLVFWELGQANLPWANLLVNFDGVQITRWIRVNLDVFVSLTQGQIYCIEASSPSTARFDCSWRVCWYELTIRDRWSWVFVSTSTRPYRCWWYCFCCCYRYRHPITPATWHSCWQASSFSAEKECPLSSSASPPRSCSHTKRVEWSEW